ncbi:MAG: hypothetical protein HY000_17790 [Planctomycetes bacterium]|nr:hypothetical protein [Planctomycetota bacterium]
MAKRTVGKSKLTPEMRRRLGEAAREARGLVYGEAGCPEWGTTFAEIEHDAKEVGHEFIRLLMEQAAEAQTQQVPPAALRTDAGEQAMLIGTEGRTIESESGGVSWNEPKAYLPQSRKAFFPSEPSIGSERGRGSVSGSDTQDGASRDQADVV